MPLFDDELIADLSRWLDSKFRLPVLGWRFGVDALVGLIPGAGDTLTSLASVWILVWAARRGVPRITLARMGLNLALDYLAGALPLLGDLFDVWWKSNDRNMALAKARLAAQAATGQPPRRARWSDWLFVGAMATGLLALLAASVFIAWWLVAWLAAGFFQLGEALRSGAAG